MGRQGRIPLRQAKYYGGFTQKDVKPTPDSPLQKLGIEKVPPIVTTAVLLDAKTHLGKGKAMEPGAVVTAKDIEAMLKAQGLGKRGLQAGDVLYIYTGWGDNWKDPDTEKFYYTKGPGLAYDAAKLHRAEEGRAGRARQSVHRSGAGRHAAGQGRAAGRHAGRPAVRDPSSQSVAVAGIHHIQNANLGELAKDKVWLSCTMILPLRAQGASGSPVRPVSIGVPGQK